MTSRVRKCIALASTCGLFSYAPTEKGGTLFRPVAKQRRPASESPSKPGLSNSAPVHSSETQNTMQPPPSIPHRLETPALSLASEQQGVDDSQTRPPSMEPQRAIPNIVTTKVSTPISVGSYRKPATPISIGSRSSSIPISPSPTPRPISGPSRLTNGHLTIEQRTASHLDNHASQSSRTPPPELSLPLSTPSKKRPASVVEHGSSPGDSPSKTLRRSQRQTACNNNPRKKVSQGASAPEFEGSPGSTPEPVEGTETGIPKSPRKHRRTKKSPIPYDPDQPGIELDPTVVTMASICVDTGQGRVSSKANEIMKNHMTWKAANRERRTQMVAEMEASKYGKTLDSGAALSPPSTSMNPSPQAINDGPAPASEPGTGGNDFDYSQTMSASKFNVQVRIGPNGETVIDEESLYVDNSAEQDTNDYTHVEESDTTKFVNSATHSKKLRGSRWSATETELFYDVRSFSMIRF